MIKRNIKIILLLIFLSGVFMFVIQKEYLHIKLAEEIINYVLRFAEVFGVLGAMYFSYKSVLVAKENIEEIRKNERPKLVIYIKQPQDSIHQVNVVIKNEGKSSAKKIRFKVKGENFKTLLGKKLSDVEIIKNGIELLAGSETLSQPIGIMMGDQYKLLKSVNTSIDIEYLDDTGLTYTSNFKLDFKGLVDTKVGESNEEIMASSLKGIRSDLKNISNNLELISHNGIGPVQFQVPDYVDRLEITDKLGEDK